MIHDMENNSTNYKHKSNITESKFDDTSISRVINNEKLYKAQSLYENLSIDEDILGEQLLWLSVDEDTWLYEINDGKGCSQFVGTKWDWLRFGRRDVKLATGPSFARVYDRQSQVDRQSVADAAGQPTLRVQEESGSGRGLGGAFDSRTYTKPKRRPLQSVVGDGQLEVTGGVNGCRDLVNQFHTKQAASAQHPLTTNTAASPNLNLTNDRAASASQPPPSREVFYQCKLKLNSPFSMNTSCASMTCSTVDCSSSRNTAMSSSLGIIDIDKLTTSQLGFNNVSTDDMETYLDLRQQNQVHYQNEKESLQYSTGSDSIVVESVINEVPISNNQLNTTYACDTANRRPPTIDTTQCLSADDNVNSELDRFSIADDVKTLKGSSDRLLDTTADNLMQISFPKSHTNSCSVLNSFDVVAPEANCDTLISPENVSWSSTCDLEKTSSNMVSQVDSPPQLAEIAEPIKCSTPLRVGGCRVKKYATANSYRSTHSVVSDTAACDADAGNVLNTTFTTKRAGVESELVRVAADVSGRCQQLNTTFCKLNEEVINGTVTVDNGPEDDCMSTASDSSVSSSRGSSHSMRSAAAVSHIHSIARIQQESLRQQSNQTRKSSWSITDGAGNGDEPSTLARKGSTSAPTANGNNRTSGYAALNNNNNYSNIDRNAGLMSDNGVLNGCVVSSPTDRLASMSNQLRGSSGSIHTFGREPMTKTTSRGKPTMSSGLRRPSSVLLPGPGPSCTNVPAGPRPARPVSVLPRPISRLPTPVRGSLSSLRSFSDQYGRH